LYFNFKLMHIIQDIIGHQQNEKCSLCDPISVNDSIRLKKKENPCLFEPNIIKYFLLNKFN